RRRPHLVLVCVVAGFALAPASPAALPVAALVAAAIAGWAFESSVAPVAAALVLAAGMAGQARIAAIDRPAGAAPPGSALDADATLLERPRPTRFGWSAPMRIDTGAARGLRVMARVRLAGWPADPNPGLRVRLRGLVRQPSDGSDPPGAGATAGGGSAIAGSGGGSHGAPSESNAGEPGTPGFGPLPAQSGAGDAFDYAAFLRSRGIGRELVVESMRVIGHRGGAEGAVDSIRLRAERALGAGLPPDLAALARGMVLGEDGDIPDDIRDDFRRSGLAHLLAASGANVMLLCALVMPLLVLAGASPRARVAVLLPLVVLYVLLAGAGASVARAGVMAAAALVALAAGRRASAVYALLLAAAATLGMNPRASADPGWRLSFAAVAGMLALGPPVGRALRGLPRPAAEALGATIAATLATSPLLAHEFGAVSISALPANALAFPAVAPVMWIGMSEAALAQIGVLGHAPADAAAWLARLAGHVTAVPLRWVEGVARRLAEPSWAQAAWHLSWAGVAAAYVAVAGAVLALTAARGRAGQLRDRLRALSARRRRHAALAAVGLVSATAAFTLAPPRAPSHLTVDYLDVGQGDATLVRDPSGAAVLFDGGVPEARVDRVLHRLGVRRLSVVVATHQSRDHHGGLLQVIRRFPVGLFLDGGDGTSAPTYRELLREVDRRGIPRRPTRAGETLTLGQMSIRILWPPPRPAGPAPADPNPRATVAIVSEGRFDLFLSADAESPTILPLDLPAVDAMKVPHHGSDDPGLPQVLAHLRPAVATIETGRGNDYGHPRPSTLDALRGSVPRVYRTDRDGTVELTVEPGGMRVRTHR
ncbi:MAG: ComEC/Rec2 family competence protein, partial [Thermoleophilaceae bacterium]